MNFLPISDGKYVIIAEHWTSMQKEDNANTKKKEKGQRKAAHTEPKQMALKQIPIPKFYARRIRRIVLRNGYGRVAVFLSLMSSAMIQTTTAMTPWTKSVEMLRLVLYFVNIFASLTLCQVYNSAEDFFDAIRSDFKNEEKIGFNGAYTISHDPLVSHRERVRMSSEEIWKVSGHRFT